MSRTVPVMRTWTAGEVETGAAMNANVRGAGSFLLGRPAFALRQTVAQSIANTTWTGLLLDTEDLDSDGGHSTVTNTSRYSCQVAGFYWVTGYATFAANATGQRSVRLYVNGNPLPAAQDDIAASISAISISRLVQLAVGDYLEVFAYQSSGAALNTGTAGPAQSCLHGTWVSQ